jgi:polyphosphate kinase 2
MAKKSKVKKAKKSQSKPVKMSLKDYESELAKLEVELVRLQGWIKHEGLKVVVIFEGRDSAGKGGIIKRITRRLNHRIVRVVALGTPTEKEKSQWYFQRYVEQLPSAGEMVLFDRSWYNRSGVEKVMGFCTDEEYRYFMKLCPGFEKSLVDSGIILIKYWLHITDETQEKRFKQRIDDPRRRWKLSPMDLDARSKWVEYSKARDAQLLGTDTKWAPWYIVDANVKRYARLNCITPRQKAKGYKHPDISNFNIVPAVYP